MIEDIVEKTTAAARHVEVEGSFHARADEVRELKSLVLQLTETVNQLKAATSKPPEPPGPPPGHKFDAVKREEALTAGAEDVEVPADEEPAAPAEDSSQALPAVGSTERHPDIRRRDLAGYEVDAENPQALSNEFLNRIFEGQRKQKNFLLWIPNTAPDCPKVRVNAKFDAWNTYVKYPDEFTWHRKSTLVQYTDGGDWELYEDRVKAHHYKAFAYTPRRCLIFLLPPRADLETDGTGKGEHFAHVALTGPDVRDAPTNIMSKKERQDFHAGLKKESHRSNILIKALGKFATLAGLIFMITPHEFADSSGISESETLFIRSPGPEGKFLSDPTWCQNISEEINNLKPDLVVTIHQIPDNHTDIDNRWLVDLYRSFSGGQVGVVIDAAVTPRWKAWQSGQIEDDRFGDFIVYETRGDLAIGTSCQHFAEPLIAWCNQQSRYHCPKSIESINDPELLEVLQTSLEDTKDRLEVEVAFPAEARQDESDILGSLDVIVDPRVDSAQAIADPDQPLIDAELLDDLPLEGFPAEEAERRKAWSRVPRKARIAIRRLHNMIGHKPKDVMLQILKGAKAEPELILACKNFKCDACAVSHEGEKTHPVAAPPRYEFNHTVIVDIFETHDDENGRHSWLSIVCSGTCYHQVIHVEQGGQPSSSKCLEKFSQYWTSWAGFPKVVTTDRGLHNRGAFAKGLRDRGVQIRTAGLESPEHIGRGERHGGIIKRTWRRVCRELHIHGKSACKVAMAHIVAEKNDYIRHGGFSPSQWVLGRKPRAVANLLDEDEFADLGAIAASMDGATAFGYQTAVRHEARKALVHQDCHRRVKSALLRNAAPLPGKYAAGDLVCYRINRVQGQAGRVEPQWSSVSRIIGFDNKTVWVVHGGVPVATSIGKLRPCTSAEALAFSIMNNTFVPGQDEGERHEEQRYLDYRDDEGNDEAPREPPTRRRRVQFRDDGLGVMASTPVPAPGTPVGHLMHRRQSSATESRAEPESEFMSSQAPSRQESSFDNMQVDVPEVPTLETSDTSLFASQATPKDALKQIVSSLGHMKRPWEEYMSFMAERVEGQDAENWLKKRKKKYVSKKRKEAAGKTLNFKRAEGAVREGMLAARQAEWAKWKQFNAAVILSVEESNRLLQEGHQVVGTQWIDVDKNEGLRTKENPDIPPKYKGRLVVRGDQEQGEVRSDSPTCDTEAQNLLFSFAASRRLRIRSADITNAYFQGEEMDRVLLLRPPKEGLEEEDLQPGQLMLARVPIYGAHDSGRKFWKKLRTELTSEGIRENAIFRALYTMTNSEGKVILMLATHVDDLLWACEPEAQSVVDKILTSFMCGKIEEGTFRYCGKDVEQDADFNIKITCRSSTMKIQKAQIPSGRSIAEPLNDEDKTSMKSIAGSLAWIARQCRPDLAYRVSRVQAASSNGCVADLKEANKHVDYAVSTSSRGLTFRSGVLSWDFSLDAMITCVITDASHANESEDMIVNGKVSKEPHRSQGGKIIALGTSSLSNSEEGGIHVIAFSSTVVRRVCRSTMQAEAYSLQAGIEEGDRIRAAVCDAFGKLDRKHWERTASQFMQQVWFSDCRSVVDSLLNSNAAKPADKRLSIELASMRQSLWRSPGEEEGDPFLRDERPKIVTDNIRWIDTSVMIADPLTKIMDPVKLIEALDNNRWNIEQPINSVIVKKAKQLQRRKEKPEDIPAWLLDLSKQQGEYILEKQIVLVNHHATQFSTLLDHPFPRRTTWILKSGRWQKTEDAVVISDLTDLHGSIQPVDIMINVFHE